MPGVAVGVQQADGERTDPLPQERRDLGARVVQVQRLYDAPVRGDALSDLGGGVAPGQRAGFR